MATKKKEATKNAVVTKKADSVQDEKEAAKAAKRKARQEALKNRPAGQRTNSKMIDIIDCGNGKTVKNYGYPVKTKGTSQGILVTSVVEVDGNPVSTSVTFVPGNLTIKSKKGHGMIVSPKAKKSKEAEVTDEPEESDDED